MKFLLIFAATILLVVSVDAISKGEDSYNHDAPFIVTLSHNAEGSHMCAGTLITKEWILTAAHCVTKAIGMVAIGRVFALNNYEGFGQPRTVDFGLKHELYVHGQYDYDIAILHVSEPFVISRYVQPAILPARAEHTQGAVQVFGWGKTKPVMILGPVNLLQQVDTELIDLQTCRTLLPEGYMVGERMVCSSSMNRGVSVCKGDDGGPLAKKIDGMTTQELIGIVSWGMEPCGQGEYPSVYTEVSQYIDWINNSMSSYNDQF